MYKKIVEELSKNPKDIKLWRSYFLESRYCVMDSTTKPPAPSYKVKNPYSPGLYCPGFRKKSRIRKLINNLFERRNKDE